MNRSILCLAAVTLLSVTPALAADNQPTSSDQSTGAKEQSSAPPESAAAKDKAGMTSEGAGADTSGGAKEQSSAPPGSSAADPDKPNPTVGAEDTMRSDPKSAGSTAGAGATEFEGTWNTQDTKGNPLIITLSADGKATGDRADEGLTGTWKSEKDSAVINWDSGWMTKIVKQGEKFEKQAFEKGDAATPTHTVDAQKQGAAGAPSSGEAPKRTERMQDVKESPVAPSADEDPKNTELMQDTKERQLDQSASEIRYVTKNRADLWRASQLEGVNVYNQQDEHVGDISEVLVNKDGQVEAVVIGVGGFLGIGQRDVAVPFNALEWVIQDRRDRIVRDEKTSDRKQDVTDEATDPERKATADRGRDGVVDRESDQYRDYPARAILRGATKEQLEKAPQFLYSD